MPQIIGSQFTGKNKYGDFAWMIKQDEYSNALFIFNDDIESIHKYQKGAGNACIRPYNSNNPAIEIPRSAGIPTGSRKQKKGFQELNSESQSQIDDAIDKIKTLILQHQYETIYYSAKSTGELGTNLFKPCHEIVEYITEQISSLSSE